ncbi:hypothetical protein [Deinococcus xianganensis]|uniref:Uncharacterized protein n=1 Tax=Deinococcus xianganensis TaxID=1507289 RepID=A0A6I4YWG4_9DEIO|nr:hypothetical protein [Deinococcus xianganensis]MXV21975.1 hypothetical protein [Deinococcus xianganensis]
MTEREALLDCIAIVAGPPPATMADLASRYRLPVDAVWTLVQTLLERGMLVCGEPARMKRGHPQGAAASFIAFTHRGAGIQSGALFLGRRAVPFCQSAIAFFG